MLAIGTYHGMCKIYDATNFVNIKEINCKNSYGKFSNGKSITHV